MTQPIGEKKILTQTQRRERRREMKERAEEIRKRMRGMMNGPLKRAMQAAGLWAAISSAGFTEDISRPRRNRSLEDLQGEIATGNGEERLSYQEMRRELEIVLGRDRLREMIPVTDEDLESRTLEKGRREEEREPRLQVRGFEQIGLSNESVQRYVAEGFPRTWTSRTAVTMLQYTNEHIPMPERYGLHGNEMGHCTISPDGSPSDIVVTIDALETDAYTGYGHVSNLLNETIPHELAHSVDWLNAAHLDPRDRLELLWRAVRRVHADDRMEFAYVESIKNANPQQELRDRATEYIAELARSAMTMPTRTTTGELRVNGDDARMMDLIAPGFDGEAATQRRQARFREMMTESFHSLQERELERVENPRLREALLDAFRLSREDMSPAFRIGRYSDVDLDEGDVDLWNAAHEHVRFELDRLRAELPLEARPAFEVWIELVRDMTNGREMGWFASAEPIRAATESANVERWDVNTLNEMMRRIRDDRARTAFDTAAHRALRVIAAGDIRLPPEMQQRMEEWLERDERETVR